MEEKIDNGKRKSSLASIPANYLSILQLQERWLKEKDRKQKEKHSVERELNGQRRRQEEEDVVKAIEPKGKLEENNLGGGCFCMHCGMNRCKKEPKCVEKKELKVSAIVSNKDEHDGGDSSELKKIAPVKEGENAARDSIVEETKFHDVWIKKRVEEQGRAVKGPARLHSRQNQTTTRTMVWVKKGKKDGAAA